MAAVPLCRLPLRSSHRRYCNQPKCSNLTGTKNEKVEENTGLPLSKLLEAVEYCFP